MTRLSITPIEGKCFGAVVTGLRLGSLTGESFAQIKKAFLESGFLLFPDQFLTDAENVDFGERFGSLEFGAAPIANQKKQGDGSFDEILTLGSPIMQTNVGNEAWHTDSTYMPVSSKCAMLSAAVVPDQGGETELADTRSGYAALDPATQKRIATLSAYHSTLYSQVNDLGEFPELGANSILDRIYHGEAYLRPLVKVHPETGIKGLLIGRHAFGIPGLGRAECRSLLTSLVDHVTADDSRVYRHSWRAGDTLLWDNRALLHRARPYDYSRPRVLIGTRIAGDPESELAYYPTDPAAQAGRDALSAELELLRLEIAAHRSGTTSPLQA